jgi:DNA invertase Pin-like site-specific DNA recombinase
LTASRATQQTFWLSPATCSAPAGIRSLAAPFLDTTSDSAEIILAILDAAAKLERRRILERIARGRADAEANGIKFGRKPILTPHQQKEARKRLGAGRRSAASPAARMLARARFLGSRFEADGRAA